MTKKHRSAGNPKSHHFVPRWYLAKFVEPQSGFLHIYDKSTGGWRKQKPDKVMKIHQFYEQKHVPQSSDPYIFEKALGEELEPRAKDAFEKVIYQPKNVTAEDTAYIACYLELQRTRVPRQAETAKQFALAVAHSLLLHGPPEVVSAIKSKHVKAISQKEYPCVMTLRLAGFEYPIWATQGRAPVGLRPPAWPACSAPPPFDRFAD
jgi:uncharacterized protein DUF4238